jgi:FMN-dependent NADH-azoreductase
MIVTPSQRMAPTEQIMANILVLNSSASGSGSVSDGLVADTVARLRQAHPDAVVVQRDLDRDALPHLTSTRVAGVRAQPATPAEHAARALSDELIAEVKAATHIVIGAPMYNFSIPTTLRTWFDHVLRPNATFSYAGGSPKGLVDDKPVYVVEARGGVYSEGPGAALDFQEPYLRQLLGFMGLTDVRFIHAEKIGFGPDARAESIAQAKRIIGELVDASALAA